MSCDITITTANTLTSSKVWGSSMLASSPVVVITVSTVVAGISTSWSMFITRGTNLLLEAVVRVEW